MEPTFRDRPYGPHASNRYDAYIVESSQPTPLQVHIHGGGFQWGDKSGVREELVRAYHERGISVVSINYRLSQESPAPAAMLDAARAIQCIRWQRKHLNIDPTRIAACGTSAGAGISLWLALHPDLAEPQSGDHVARESSTVQAVVVDDAQTSYDPLFIREHIAGEAWRERALVQFHRFDPDTEPDEDLRRQFEAVSPINFVSPEAPPVWMWYWTRDLPLDDDLASGKGIHHPHFGRLLQKRMHTVGATCEVRYREEHDELTNEDYVSLRIGQGADFVTKQLG
jgi:acetyl esterase/lipase